MEMHGGDRRSDDFGSTSYPHPDDRSPHIFNREHSNEFNGHHHHQVSSHPPPLAGQKRQFHHPNGGFDCGGFVKLYVVGITRTATEQDIMAVFGEYGHIIEVVLLKDKRTGLQQEACFVKYATVDQADRAIVAFHQYTFPGATIQMKVKYADGERERLGSLGVQVSKLYIGCLNRQASRWDIEEIFAPFGIIEEIFVVRDEFKQNRGCAFVQFSCRDMAIAAIQALHGSYMMRGCDQPLIVRFADPKKPRVGDPRPTSCMNDPSNGHMPSSHEMWQMKEKVLGSMTSAFLHENNGSCMHLKSSHSGCNTSTISSTNTAPSVHTTNSVAETEHSIECDWSEHVSPDGDLYYYNCVTCESRWEKPEEYSLYEQELDKLEEEHPLLGSNQGAFSSPDMSEAQKVI